MKQIKLTTRILLCLLFLPFFAYTQEANSGEQKFNKHEIGISCGLFAEAVSKAFLTTKNTKKAQRAQFLNVMNQPFVNFVKPFVNFVVKDFDF